MYDDRTYLDNNAVLHLLGREYHITGLEGAGTSSIVYNATVSVSDNSIKTEKKVLIKELYPLNLSIGRNKTTGALIIPERSQNNFKKYIESFEKAAELQIELHNPLEKESNTLSATNSTSSIEDVCEHGNTLYSVMSVDNGQTYEEYKNNDLRSHIEICKNLAEAIQKYHKRGYLHLDIKPKNIFVLAESNHIKLFDFDTVQRKEDINNCNCQVTFTNEYAPPELELTTISNAYYSDLDERTDIYMIGATLFDKLLNHTPSLPDRFPFQTWDFDESEVAKTASPQVKAKITDVFRKTLAQLQEERFCNISELVNALDCIHDLLTFKYNLVNQNIYKTSGDYYIPRTQETKQIRDILNEKHIAYLYGMGGIGKSETARAYAEEYRNDYSVVQLVSYYSDLEVTIESLIFSDDDQYKKTGNTVSRFEYVYNRLQSGLINNERILIIIDNYNLDYTDTEENRCIIEKNNKVVRELKKLSIHFIFTTRNTPSLFNSDKAVMIDSFSPNQLSNLFFKINPFNQDDPERIEKVNKIIELTGKHVLLIDLIARLSLEKEEWGDCTLDDIINEISLSGFNNNYDDLVESNKDDRLREDSVYNIIKSLFDFSSLSHAEQYILVCTSLLPTIGTEIHAFCEVINHGNISKPDENKTIKNIKNLVKKGWLNRIHDKIISMHPMIADVALNELNNLFDSESFFNIYRWFEAGLKGFFFVFPLDGSTEPYQYPYLHLVRSLLYKLITRMPFTYNNYILITHNLSKLFFDDPENYIKLGEKYWRKSESFIFDSKNLTPAHKAWYYKELCKKYSVYPSLIHKNKDIRDEILYANIDKAKEAASVSFNYINEIDAEILKAYLIKEISLPFTYVNDFDTALFYGKLALKHCIEAKTQNQSRKFSVLNINSIIQDLYRIANYQYYDLTEMQTLEQKEFFSELSKIEPYHNRTSFYSL